MVSDGLDEITEIKKLTRATIFLYAKNSRKNLSGSDIVSIRFILDLKKAVFKMIHIKNLIYRVINPSNIDKKWCRSMNEKIELEQGWNRVPLRAHYSNLVPSQIGHSWSGTMSC